MRHARHAKKGSAFAAGAVLLVACFAAVTTAREAHTAPAADIDPTAVRLGDGRVSATPKVRQLVHDELRRLRRRAGGGALDRHRREDWDDTAKLAVQGAVRWPTASYSASAVGSKRAARR